MGAAGAFAPMFDSQVSRLEFADLLVALQVLLGVELDVVIYLPGGSFTAAFRARLLRVAELPPDNEAVTLVFEGREAVTLAPEEVALYCGRADGRADRRRWIEAQIQPGPCLLIEEVPASERG